MTKKKKNTTKGREEEEEEEEKEEVAKNVAGDSDSGSWGLRLFRFFTDAYRSFSRVSPFSVDPIKGPNRRVSVINLLRVDLIAGSPVLCFLVFFPSLLPIRRHLFDGLISIRSFLLFLPHFVITFAGFFH